MLFKRKQELICIVNVSRKDSGSKRDPCGISDDTICSFEIKPFNLVIRVPSTKDNFIQVKRGF
jgi:hypothetical protein